MLAEVRDCKAMPLLVAKFGSVVGELVVVGRATQV